MISVIKVLSGLAEALSELVFPIVLGALGLYIAWQQWQTNRQRTESERRDRQFQRKRDLYDRRWRVYAEVLMCIETIARRDVELQVIQDALFRLRRARLEADFLFDSDVESYLGKVIEACDIVHRYKLLGKQPDPAQAKKDWENRMTYLDSHRHHARKVFAGYLKLSDSQSCQSQKRSR